MTIRQKFSEFKKETKHVYDKDFEMNTLDITVMNMEGLYNSGYFERKIDSFLYFNEFSEKDYNEFYCSECQNILLNDLSYFQDIDPECKVYDLIRMIKTESVRAKLFYDLINFIGLLKKEKINKN